ncbi:flavanone 3-dioxygenase 2-like [Andrographis paniculata]|uniref:flavanone 3-dioxygenase 2-like n=1 Tax=Andrographis paniculata TaxID=175694 RepID=UPI0021E85673|nr:flavanone 3-dioxygenase 2-like [Andrographis paniculata]
MDNKPFVLANGTLLSIHDDKFILPAAERPAASKSIPIPVIDLDEKQASLIGKIRDACEGHGVFHIINHGVPKELCRKMIGAVHDFFRLPAEERSHLFTDDKTKPLRVSNFYLNGDDDKFTMWSEVLAHPWHPSDDFSHLLPRNPPHYRELAGEYAKEVGWLVTRLLRLISQALGLKKDYLQERLGDKPRLVAHANYYPPCPRPELTLGSLSHTDVIAITVLLQSEDVSALQVMQDGQWVPVDPLPGALLVNIGDQIEVMSNGKYKSVHHRVVTNKDLDRASIAMFYGPNMDSMIGPIDELLDEEHPPIYRTYCFREFMEEFLRQESTVWRVKEAFRLNH